MYRPLSTRHKKRHIYAAESLQAAYIAAVMLPLALSLPPIAPLIDARTFPGFLYALLTDDVNILPLASNVLNSFRFLVIHRLQRALLLMDSISLLQLVVLLRSQMLSKTETKYNWKRLYRYVCFSRIVHRDLHSTKAYQKQTEAKVRFDE